MVDEDRSAVRRGYMDLGWLRFMPLSAVYLVGEFTVADAVSRADFSRRLTTGTEGDQDGLSRPAWDDFDPWTEESLRDIYDTFPREPSDERTVEQANAEDEAAHNERIATIDGYAAQLGVRAPRTLADVLDYMVACRFLIVAGARDDQVYQVNPKMPLPTEVLKVPAEVLKREDELRWQALYEPVLQDIIRLFAPGGPQPLDSKRTSLQRLAKELDTDVDTTRAALAVLAQERDFTVTLDPEQLPEHRVFEIRVDWEDFARDRIGVRAGRLSDE